MPCQLGTSLRNDVFYINVSVPITMPAYFTLRPERFINKKYNGGGGASTCSAGPEYGGGGSYREGPPPYSVSPTCCLTRTRCTVLLLVVDTECPHLIATVVVLTQRHSARNKNL
uniref:SFRICE_033254 n=1 Tax=Spodoptera frugiperda TaxID=7108 RepID=A0A2H1VW59_SPOFR